MNTIEVNGNLKRSVNTFVTPTGAKVMMTPEVGEDYWLYRVPLKHGQAIIAFPKFGILGCGFAKEEDWNTNLPLDCGAREIYSHIKHNKKYADITDTECIAAIESLQTFVRAQKAGVR